MYVSFNIPLRPLKWGTGAITQIISAEAGLCSGLHRVAFGLAEHGAVTLGPACQQELC